ncbi:MAG: hypothetical protein KF865_03160 [Bdellovibrionaceae bacterium]|nr:hypothetical protein [Pseudobdellovibrionaceae bacterium]
MEQAINFYSQGACPLVLTQRNQRFIWKFWRWLKWIGGGVLHAMFVPSETDRQIEEQRNRARELMSRSY